VEFRRRTLAFSGVAALSLALLTLPQTATAGAIGYIGTGGWGLAGPGVANATCVTCVFTWTNLGINFVLADGLAVTMDANETFVEVGGFTTSAYLRVTNVVAANLSPNLVSDNIYLFSDYFDPSLAGPAGVGVIGEMGTLGLGAGFYGASVQGQMNYLISPLINPLAAPGFSLTTPSFAIDCTVVGPCPVGWYGLTAFVGLAPGGVQQLVGGLNFTLAPNSTIVMPGSMIVEDNDNAAITSEIPEPVSLSLFGGGLIGLAMLRRRKK
jgi:hypothetical protein